MIEKITPDSKEHWLEMRTKVISSTESSALFGANKYLTPFELWHQKKNGTVVTIEETERMKFGNILEDVIASETCSVNEWVGEPFKDYWVASETRTGSSFDWQVVTRDGPAILEIKNVDGLVFSREWGKDKSGGLMAPPHLEFQLQHQLMMTEFDTIYLAALVGGNSLKIIKRTRNEKVIAAIIKKIAEFWTSIDENNPPAPDFEKDHEFINKLFGYTEKGTELKIDGDCDIWKVAEKHRDGSDAEKAGKLNKDAAKAELLTLIGDTQKVYHTDFTLSSSTNKYNTRVVRISWKDKKC